MSADDIFKLSHTIEFFFLFFFFLESRRLFPEGTIDNDAE